MSLTTIVGLVLLLTSTIIFGFLFFSQSTEDYYTRGYKAGRQDGYRNGYVDGYEAGKKWTNTK